MNSPIYEGNPSLTCSPAASTPATMTLHLIIAREFEQKLFDYDVIYAIVKWHPDKRKDDDIATSRFQEINEAYKVLSNPLKRQEYDRTGISYVQDHNVTEYLNRHKSLILTCNGLGIRYSLW
ncbi:hypothetical protein Taro_033474 [Colocasia esculenta]|uniref:J domain-containing protein n=1 Tax=Colocasia esculenta TaxID=4460 RepID=A0A843VVD9_COLES|nr:hypothetical protein [Colocasia esculenta]